MEITSNTRRGEGGDGESEEGKGKGEGEGGGKRGEEKGQGKELRRRRRRRQAWWGRWAFSQRGGDIESFSPWPSFPAVCHHAHSLPTFQRFRPS